ncbi:hypothetical protein [Tessaracoccus lacteus]|uniref:Uncharacterized protein n=1 Tax=Tessaracoccus lacteus TaxID=3041766 RepID=A0ABY8PXT6_9ACTN|nr:hypothetical protein [Tessaracoccus sp. T21]WGT47217.1 hypothetical protein QH948_00015 [Tessaracoccus sp. T21]
MTTIRVFCDGPSHPEGSKWWVAEFVDSRGPGTFATPLTWEKGVGRQSRWEAIYSRPPARYLRRLEVAIAETPGPLDIPGEPRSDLDAREARSRARHLEDFEQERKLTRDAFSKLDRLDLAATVGEMDLQQLTATLKNHEYYRVIAAKHQARAERDRKEAAKALLPSVDFAAGRHLIPTRLDGDEIAEGYGERAVVRLECRRCRVARDYRGEKLSAILDALASNGLQEVSLQSIIRVLS